MSADTEDVLEQLWDRYSVSVNAIHLSIDGLQAINPSMTDEVLARDYNIVRGRDFVTLTRDGIQKGIEP